MAQQTINLGTLGGADGTGDSIRAAAKKIDDNFVEIYNNNAMSSQIQITGNNIKATQSNSDLFFDGSGTGVVAMANLLVDSNIQIEDNTISTTVSNSNIELTPAGTGSVVVSKVDVNSGNIDNTTIGATTPAAGTFTTLTVPTLNADGVVITDNEIITNASNSELQLDATGTGKVSINGIKIPASDGGASQVLQTNGSGTLSFVTSPILFDNTDITDGTDTITGNSVAQTFDQWSASTYRSANYLVQASDSTANRFGVVELNVTHDGSNAFISVFGATDNGTGDGSTVYDSLEFTAIINSGNVRVRAKVNNTNSQVLKFVRRIIKA